MDIEKNGESSSAAAGVVRPLDIERDGMKGLPGVDRANGADGSDGDVVMGSSSSMAVQKTRLILPEWDVATPKHLHPSHDLISLLHLDGLFNTFVRPYFEPVPDSDDEEGGGGGGSGGPGDGGGVNGIPNGAGGVSGAAGAGAGTGGKKKGRKDVKRKQGLSKGYIGLLEDCIDPVPAGNKPDLSLLSLIPDLRHPPTAPPPSTWTGPIEPMLADQLSVARLEQGMKVEGYAGGEKLGVREAEEKRNRRKQLRLSQSIAPEPLPSTPGPSIAPPSHLSARLNAPGSAPAGGSNPSFPNTTSTPAAHPGTFRRPSAPNTAPGGGGGGGKHVFSRATAPPSARPYVATPGSGGGNAGAGGSGRAPNTPTPMPRFPFARAGDGSGSVATPTKRPLEGSGAGGGGGVGGGGWSEGPGGSGLLNVAKRPKGGSRSASPGDVGVKAMFKGARSRTGDS